MLKSFTQEIKNISRTPDDLKKFAWLMLLVFFLLSLYSGWREYTIVFSIMLIVWIYFWIGLVYCRILLIPYLIWMTLALILGNIIMRLILIIIFFIGFVPFSFVLKLFKRDLFKLKIDKKIDSYWLDIEDKNSSDNYLNPY